MAQTLQPPPPRRAPRGSYTPVAALSAVSSVSQGCRKGVAATHPPPQWALSHPIPDPPVGCRGQFGPPQPCRTPGGGAATLASVALQFATKHGIT